MELCSLNKQIRPSSWRSLSERGFHFIKKYVLFYLAENQVQGLATAEFSHQIPEDRFELLVGYIEYLLINTIAKWPFTR